MFIDTTQHTLSVIINNARCKFSLSINIVRPAERVENDSPNSRVSLAILSHYPEIFSIAHSFYDSQEPPYPLCPMDNPATERKIKSWVQRCSQRAGKEGRRVEKKKEKKKEKKREGDGRRGGIAPDADGQRGEGPRQKREDTAEKGRENEKRMRGVARGDSRKGEEGERKGEGEGGEGGGLGQLAAGGYMYASSTAGLFYFMNRNISRDNCTRGAATTKLSAYTGPRAYRVLHHTYDASPPYCTTIASQPPLPPSPSPSPSPPCERRTCVRHTLYSYNIKA